MSAAAAIDLCGLAASGEVGPPARPTVRLLLAAAGACIALACVALSALVVLALVAVLAAAFGAFLAALVAVVTVGAVVGIALVAMLAALAGALALALAVPALVCAALVPPVRAIRRLSARTRSRSGRDRARCELEGPAVVLLAR